MKRAALDIALDRNDEQPPNCHFLPSAREEWLLSVLGRGGLFSLISPRRRHLSILCFVSGLIMTDLPPSVLLHSPADKPSVMEMGGEGSQHQLERGRLDSCENYANKIIWTRDSRKLLRAPFSVFKIPAGI